VQQSPFPPPSEQPPPAYQGQPQSDYSPYQGQQQPGPSPYQGQPGYWFPPSQPPSTSKIALKYGLIAGAIMVGGIILQFILARMLPFLIVYYRISIIQAVLFFSTIPLAVLTLINWTSYFLAGFFTARKGGTAIIACLWAGLCYLVIYCLSFGINIFLLMAARSGRVSPGYFTSLGIGIAIMLALHALGIGIGILGGLLGKNAARKQMLSQRGY
jgi:hypothetical protein